MNKKNKKLIIKDLGKISYQYGLNQQEKYFSEIIKTKKSNYRKEQLSKTDNFLLFVEHYPVYTLGKSGDINNLLANMESLIEKDIEFFKTNRGGDITFHGPGQVVVYPILDLDNFFTDIHKYLRTLEEVIITTLLDYGISGFRISGQTGVWVGNDKFSPKKICAFGVRASRWVTMHGMSLNVNTNLDYFNNIIPCGINDKGVTSMKEELGKKILLSEVKKSVTKHFINLFEIEAKI
ncbi:MAG: lipoyl(octanoyl) transferase [Flavobacteriaceae bacterium]|nr:lipoyl(octanoyl) transferase [Flavobacteriaceae bacterium]|tara:strand:+ start:11900 stop:12607 length:708 start_codon:yes stop_codon:yes gene_type:complete